MKMKIHTMFYLLPFLFGIVLADYDDDRSPFIEIDWKDINQTMSNAHKKCYRFVTPMRRKEEKEFGIHYEKSLNWLKWVSEDPDRDVYRDYLNETLGYGQTKWNVWSAFVGMENVKNMVIKVVTRSILMFMIYFFLKYVKWARELIFKNLQNIRLFKFTVTIPAIMGIFLLGHTLEFFVTAGEAEHALRIGQVWQRDFQTHHTSWVDDKTRQFQCIADEYWVGLEKFRHMSGPFFVYRDALMMTSGVFGDYNLGNFIQKYRGLKQQPDLKHDDVFYTTYRMMNSIHLKINKSEPWGPDKRVNELKYMFKNYLSEILQLPTQNQVFIFKMMVTAMNVFTLVVGFGIAYAPFMEEIEVKNWIVPKLEKVQNVILVIIVVEAAMFCYLLTQVAGAQAVHKALTDVNNTFLEGLKSSEGLDLESLFGESQKPGRTLIEMYFHKKFIFDARPELFESKVTEADFNFLNFMFFPANVSQNIYPGFEGNVSSLINFHKLYEGIAQRLSFNTKESETDFIGIIFEINFRRHATSLAQYVLVPVSSPVWSLCQMGVCHFIIACWIFVALPHVKNSSNK